MRNSIMKDALLSNPKTLAIIQAKRDTDRQAHEEHLVRYNELKELLKYTFKTRQDVVYHALYRPEGKGSASRLWWLASTPENFSNTKAVLEWASTSEECFTRAKLLVNPPCFEEVVA